MTKTRVLNGAVATVLITLLTLSVLNVSTMLAKAQSLTVISPFPAEGYVFTEVTLEGTGWHPLATVKIYFNSTANGIFEYIKDVTTNATGGFKTTAIVPPVPPGDYTWYAFIPNTDKKAVADFTVSAGIGVKPDEGPVGSTVRVAGSASEWVGGNVASIIFDKNDDGDLDAGEILKNVTATARGVIDTTVVIPDVRVTADTKFTFYANKTGPVKIGDSLAGNYAATFTVKAPTLAINPVSGPVLSSVSVAGNYFKVNYKVNITLVQGSTVKAVLATNVPTNSTGGFNETVTIPFCTKAGSYKFNATDGINYPSSLPSFTVSSPTITVSPTTAKVGESTTVEGKDFAILKPVTIYFSIESARAIPVKTVTTNATGGFKTSVTVPPVPNDDHGTDIVVVNATDECNSDTADFDVKAAITLSPARGKAGVTNVTVTGTGFRNETTVDITFGTTTVKENVPTDEYGSFTTSFIVPEGVPDGSYTVTATDEVGNSASASFQVIAVEFQLILEAVQEVEEKLDYIKPKIDSLVTTLSTIDLKLDAITYRMGSFTGEDTIASLLYAIEGKLDKLPAFGDLVTKNWADLTGYIDSAKSDIIAAMPELPPLDLSPVLNELGNETYGLAAIKNAVSGLSAQLGTFTGTDTVASLLYDIKSKIGALTGAQATSNGGSTTFTSSSTAVLYAGAKVGTVTVSLKTAGVGYGERLNIRYYTDPSNPTVYIEKTVVSGTNTAGWTDAAAAWKVEIAYAWRSGTDIVYWGYSAVYPP